MSPGGAERGTVLSVGTEKRGLFICLLWEFGIFSVLFPPETEGHGGEDSANEKALGSISPARCVLHPAAGVCAPAWAVLGGAQGTGVGCLNPLGFPSEAFVVALAELIGAPFPMSFPSQ